MLSFLFLQYCSSTSISLYIFSYYWMLVLLLKAINLIFIIHTIKNINGKLPTIMLAFISLFGCFQYMLLITGVIAELKCHLIAIWGENLSVNLNFKYYSKETIEERYYSTSLTIEQFCFHWYMSNGIQHKKLWLLTYNLCYIFEGFTLV